MQSVVVFRQESDPDRDLVHLVFDDEVTTTDLAGHRRAAILAARDIGTPFSVVVDLTNCERVSSTVAEEIRETVAYLAPFGLDREIRLVDESTPAHVDDTFDFAGDAYGAGNDAFDVEVCTVRSLDAVDDLADCSSGADS